MSKQKIRYGRHPVKVLIALVIAWCLLVAAAVAATSTRRFEAWDIYLAGADRHYRARHRHCNRAIAVMQTGNPPRGTVAAAEVISLRPPALRRARSSQR